MEKLRQWAKNRVPGYLLVGALACSLTLLPGCTKTQISETTEIIDTAAAVVTVAVLLATLPPGSDVANFDVGQGLFNLSLSNATIYSTSGTATVTVKDESNGNTLGQQSFGWVVSGDSIYAANPTAVHDWLQQFSGYADVEVDVKLQPQLQTTAYGSASATTNAEYDGTTYASSYVGWGYTNPKQQCNPSPCKLGPSKK